MEADDDLGRSANDSRALQLVLAAHVLGSMAVSLLATAEAMIRQRLRPG
jgi:hypothetical protein